MVRNPGFFKQIKLICSICTKARVFAFTATPSDEALKFVKSPPQIAVQLDADDADSKTTYMNISPYRVRPHAGSSCSRRTRIGHQVMIFTSPSMFAEFMHYLVKSRM
jgi:superfamily II DNA/RNA helicase